MVHSFAVLAVKHALINGLLITLTQKSPLMALPISFTPNQAK